MVADTGIFIEFLRKHDKTKTILYQLPDDTELMISVITLYELLMGAKDESKKRDVKLLTEPLIILPLTKTIIEKSGKIYHELRLTNQMIEFRDVFIAATAIVSDVPILTRNKKHFSRIKDLALV